MLKRIYGGLAVAYEITTDFIRYLRKSWLSVILFLFFSSGLFLFVVYILGINTKDIAADIIAGFISIPIVYFIIKFFYTYSPEERKRLMSDFHKCVEFYKDSGLDFIEYKGEKYPSVIIYKPTCRLKLKDIEVKVIDEPYKLPDTIRSLYEPVEDRIKKRFLDEGFFNFPKARMVDFNAGEKITAKIQQTYYYYSFITNFFADYSLFNKKVTLRQVYKDEFIKNIRFLNKEITSNHLGFGGFIITRDGKIPLFLRRSSTAVSSRMLGNTFNGSVDWYGAESIHKSVRIELKEEIGIDASEENVFLMGVERNTLWLGKTDIHLITFSDGDLPELWEKIKKSRTKEENLNLIPLDLGVAIKSLDDLAQNKGEILENLDKELETLWKKYQLSLPLITGLYLFESFVELEM